MKLSMTVLDSIKYLTLYTKEQLSTIFSNESNAPVPYLQGAPGIGKSETIKKFGKALGKKLYGDENAVTVVVDHIATKPLEYMSGIPKIINMEDKYYTVWSVPEVITRLKVASQKSSLVIWFVDDIHQMPQQHGRYFFELFTERKLHGYSLPKNSVIVLAGNDSEEAGLNPMFSPIINRVGIYKLEASTDEWMQVSSGIELVTEDLIDINKNEDLSPVLPHDSIVSFFEHKGLPDIKENTYSPFTTPRSIAMAGKLISRYLQNKSELNENDYSFIERITYAHLSPEDASEYMNWLMIYSKINVIEYLNGESELSIKIDENLNVAQVYAITRTGLNYVARLQNENKDKGSKVLSRMIDLINDLEMISDKNPVVPGIIISSVSVFNSKLANNKIKNRVLEHFTKKLSDRMKNIVLGMNI